MFTGLIQDVGSVRSVEERAGALRVGITTNIDLTKIAIGASVACSGICLTVTEKQEKSFYVDISAETLKVTSAGAWRAGSKVNIEPSLHLGDELGGHFVFGHVDALAEVIAVTHEGESKKIDIEVPNHLAHFIAAKGSVSLDGVSLTVNTVENNRFSVNIIPHTLAHTTLGDKKPGDALNIEIDMLARYVARMMEASLKREAA